MLTPIRCNTLLKFAVNCVSINRQISNTSRKNVGGIFFKKPVTNRVLYQQPDRLEVYRRCFCTSKQSTFFKDNVDLFENIDFDEITGGDEEKLKQLKLYILEIDVQRQEGYEVPTKISTTQWKNLMELDSWHRRKKYLRFLFINEKKEENDRRKKLRKRLEREEMHERRLEDEEENQHLKYRLHHNAIFIRLTDTTIHHYTNNRLIQAMRFGQDLIIDCGFDSYMTMKEASNCAQQLMYAFAENRNNLEPFNLHFCNANPSDRSMKILKKYIPTMYDKHFPMNVHEVHYLDLFPREKLVYLTPHCNQDLREFNHDDVYIIGAIVDKTNVEPLSLARAKSEGLRMARFPLDRYLAWGCGTKSLTIDQSLNIMLTLKATNSWTKALQHVPLRKVVRQQPEPDDDVSHYGQSYVGQQQQEWGQRGGGSRGGSGGGISMDERRHEWGVPKRRNLTRHLDLRDLLHKKDNV